MADEYDQPLVTEAMPETASSEAVPSSDELDSLLAQYASTTDEKTHADEQPAIDQTAFDIRQSIIHQQQVFDHANEMSTRAAELMYAQALEAHNRDLKTTIADVRGDLDPALFSDEFLQTWLDAKAKADEALQQTWLNRAQDPQALARAKDNLAREFHKTFSRKPIDPEVSEDRAAVAWAMRGASSRMPESAPANLGRMSNKEFSDHARSEYGFDPGV